jgi:hypothetical protein
MAAKGTVAKTKVEEIIKEACGKDYIGIFDKKIYVWADDGGEKTQISLALTCPKTMVGIDTSKGFDFENPVLVAEPSSEITEEEKNTIADLMARLGL